ncbi:MAG: PilX N-terminal domain-containing pilus assembly protein [Gammaproteobacteria bacterium]
MSEFMNEARRRPSVRPLPAAHRGAILVTSMLLLLVLTIVGITALQMSRMQERMAGNTRDLNLAFQGSEAGLRNGETLLQLQKARPDTCVATPCQFWARGTLLNPERKDSSWWDSTADEFEADNDQAAKAKDMTELKADPEYLVESIGFVSDSLTVGHSPPQGRDFYQVTGRSTGGSGTPNTVLRSTYARRF